MKHICALLLLLHFTPGFSWASGTSGTGFTLDHESDGRIAVWVPSRGGHGVGP